MFRTLFKGTHIKQFYRKFSEEKIPTFSIAWSQKNGINIENQDSYTLWFNGPSNSSTDMQADYNYNLLDPKLVFLN